MLLYRGNRSDLAKAWRTDGIMSSLMMGGKPATIELIGFWEAAMRCLAYACTNCGEHLFRPKVE